MELYILALGIIMIVFMYEYVLPFKEYRICQNFIRGLKYIYTHTHVIDMLLSKFHSTTIFFILI